MAKSTIESFEPTPSSKDELTAGAFRSLLQAFQSIGVPLVPDRKRAVAEHHRQQVKALVERHVIDEKWRELMHRASEAAEHGEHEFLLLRFPSDSCTDRGQAIVEHEPGWAQTLTGDAADAYRHWHNELKSRGFELSARILEFPGGKPGDVGLFLRWQD